ncbi:MAG: hypothetical protein K5656_04410 [Lachnospiraceae bacterium]|nr:hypothetical protein [Lachnospiraceae bacterium]
MSKRRILAVVVAFVIIFAVGYGVGAGAASNQPGSAGDPVITKSYLDTRITEFNKQAGFKEVTLDSGSVLKCSKGSTFIVVSGSGKSTGALVDISLGSALASSKAVTKNHSYLVKKASTGVKATADCTVYVCGVYEIK